MHTTRHSQEQANNDQMTRNLKDRVSSVKCQQPRGDQFIQEMDLTIKRNIKTSGRLLTFKFLT